VPHNSHEGGILDTSRIPAPPEIAILADEATALAGKVADALGHVGVLTLEFFATPDGPRFNEMAPRVHNSGHWTIEGTRASQFENHIRAVCGLPLGSTELTAPEILMKNLLGEDVHDWCSLLADRRAHLHLYGKSEVKPGRKMGHVTWL
jgi:5-(carboxyamino)imidazole ribonucleotide synthase